MEGKVKWFNWKKGYGFIIGDDGKEYFVHSSQAKDELQNDDRVSFTPTTTSRGRQAKEAKLIVKN